MINNNNLESLNMVIRREKANCCPAAASRAAEFVSTLTPEIDAAYAAYYRSMYRGHPVLCGCPKCVHVVRYGARA